MTTQQEISLRQLATLIGVSEKAVRKARRAGVFSASAIAEVDGVPVVLDPTLAIAEWVRSGRTVRGPAARTSRSAPAAPMSVASSASTAASLLDLDERDGDRDEGPPDPLPGVNQLPSLVDAQTLAMMERARKLKLENDLREGQLVEASRAAKEAFEFARVLREATLNIPARLSAELAGETDETRVFKLLDGALREALETTAKTLEADDGE